MAENSGVWDMTPTIQSIDPNEKLFLFGYSCKLFRDDEKAKYIDQGKHLISWMGDDTLKIDRYDVRGYLHDLKLYEAKPGGYPEDVDTEEEKLCEEERYRSLRSEFTEEQLYHEEELKRLRAAVASDGAYHEIGFSYDSAVENSEPLFPKVEEPEDEPYEAPPGLVNPKGLETPSTMKIHAIVEKTAMFVSEQGGQMEIIIKMKQHANPQFGFMQMDNPLHPYYRHLIKAIKSGSYKPVQTRRVSRSEDEDDDGNYLHPSLTSGKKENVPQFTVPSINFKRSHDDSYSVLVRNLQQQLAEEKLAKEQQEEVLNTAEDQSLVNYSYIESGSSSFNDSYLFSLVVPPPDVQPIIHKMADYVAKNGEDFEIVVKSKNDKRFEFLQPTSTYYNYYMQLRDEAKLKYAPAIVTQSLEASYNDYFSNYESNGIESYNEDVFQNENEVAPPSQNVETASENTLDEFDALYTQDSQDIVLSLPTEVQNEDAGNSMDSVDSIGVPKHLKFKSSKIPKGPISFSLKSKEGETVPAEKTKIPLLLDDSGEEGENNEIEKKESSQKEKSTEEKRPSSNSKRNSAEKEEKQKLSSEMEAKLVEEQKKNKLLSAARERLLQHKKEKRLLMEKQKREEELKTEKMLQIEQYRKDKELQLERKKKAALFLKMLKKRDPESAESLANKLKKDQKEKSKDIWSSEGILTENGVVFPDPNATLHIRKKVRSRSSSSSASEESGEEIMITEFCSNPDQVVEIVPEKVPEPVKQERKKKKKKRSRSKSRERRSKSSRSKDRRRSRSPKNHKHEKSRKEKELPAAYALKKSRSRSRSPRRYRQMPSSYYNRRR